MKKPSSKHMAKNDSGIMANSLTEIKERIKFLKLF